MNTKSLVVLFICVLSLFRVSEGAYDIGAEVTAIPLGDIFGAAMTSVAEAQGTASDAALRFIYSTFSNTSGNFIQNNIKFSYTKKLDNGTTTESTMEVPILTMVPVPYILVSDLTINFNFNIQTNYQASYSLHAEIDFPIGQKINLAGSVAAQVQYDASTQVKRTFNLEVTMKASKAETPNGLSHMIQALTDVISDAPAAE